MMMHGMICGMDLETHQSDALRPMTQALIFGAPMTTENWEETKAFLKEEQRKLNLQYSHQKNPLSPLLQGLQLPIDNIKVDQLEVTPENRKLLKEQFAKEQATLSAKIHCTPCMEQRSYVQDQNQEDK
jgi:hypothetical protein